MKETLKRYSYADDKTIIERIKNCNGTDEIENKDIINSIVLWKINRQVDIGLELFCKIKKLDINFANLKDRESEIKNTILELLQVKGVRIAMASTILKMFYPNVFPIVDQRAYRELVGSELPKYYGLQANERYTEMYYEYVFKCHDYNAQICPEIKFEDIDKLLYQLDLEKGYKINY